MLNVHFETGRYDTVITSGSIKDAIDAIKDYTVQLK